MSWVSLRFFPVNALFCPSNIKTALVYVARLKQGVAGMLRPLVFLLRAFFMVYERNFGGVVVEFLSPPIPVFFFSLGVLCYASCYGGTLSRGAGVHTLLTAPWRPPPHYILLGAVLFGSIAQGQKSCQAVDLTAPW